MKKNNFHKNKKDEILCGWKEIASYLDKIIGERSIRTYQRYKKKYHLPCHFDEENRIFSTKKELEKWGKDFLEGKFEEKNSKNKTIFVVAILLLTFFILFTSSNNSKTAHKKKLTPLISELKFLQSVAILNIYSQSEKPIKKFIFDFKKPSTLGGKCNFFTQRPFFYKIIDINGDGLSNLIIINPDDFENLELWKQTKDGRLILKKNINFAIEKTFEGKKYEIDNIGYINAGDVNGDGKNEIIVSLHHSLSYPSCVAILDENLKIKYKIFHPGWLYYTVIKDLNGDGKNELYISGTNNYIYKKDTGEEIAIGIEGKFENGEELLLYRPYDRKMFKTVPPNIKVSYVRLNFLPFIDERFQISRLIDQKTASLKNKIGVAGGIIVLEGYPKNTPYWAAATRIFIFNYMLKFDSAFWNSSSFLKINNLNLNEKFEKKYENLLIPYYWNGKTWQNKWCLVPNRKN